MLDRNAFDEKAIVKRPLLKVCKLFLSEINRYETCLINSTDKRLETLLSKLACFKTAFLSLQALSVNFEKSRDHLPVPDLLHDRFKLASKKSLALNLKLMEQKKEYDKRKKQLEAELIQLEDGIKFIEQDKSYKETKALAETLKTLEQQKSQLTHRRIKLERKSSVTLFSLLANSESEQTELSFARSQLQNVCSQMDNLKQKIQQKGELRILDKLKKGVVEIKEALHVLKYHYENRKKDGEKRLGEADAKFFSMHVEIAKIELDYYSKIDEFVTCALLSAYEKWVEVNQTIEAMYAAITEKDAQSESEIQETKLIEMIYIASLQKQDKITYLFSSLICPQLSNKTAFEIYTECMEMNAVLTNKLELSPELLRVLFPPKVESSPPIHANSRSRPLSTLFEVIKPEKPQEDKNPECSLRYQ